MSRQITILNAKLANQLKRLESLHAQTKEISNFDSRRSERFLTDTEDILRLQSSIESLIDDLVACQLEVAPDTPPDYTELARSQSLFAKIMRARNQLLAKASPGPASNVKKFTCLPPLEIPYFDGSPENWPFFFQSFSTNVHNNNDLNDAQRVQYLIGKLSANALQITDGVIPTGENYKFIWDRLVKKYQDKRSLGIRYLNNILNHKIGEPSPNNISTFIEKYYSSISALKRLNITDLADFILLHIGIKKLDVKTVSEFENSVRDIEIPTTEQFVKFIQDQVKIMERTHYKPTYAPKNKGKPETKSLSFMTVHSEVCELCKETHAQLYMCSEFKKLEPKKRIEIVKEKGLCLNCLGKFHRVKDCNSKSLCRFCKAKHHSLLCIKSTTKSDTPSSPEPKVTLCTLSKGNRYRTSEIPSTTCLLSTAHVLVKDAKGKLHEIRAIIDSASQVNIITRKCCAELGLEVQETSATHIIKGIGELTNGTRNTVHLEFTARNDNSKGYADDFLVVDRLTDSLPAQQIDELILHDFRNLPLADPTFYKPGAIHLLLGASIFAKIISAKKVQIKDAVAIETTLGFIITGNVPLKEPSTNMSYSYLIQNLETIIQKFWELEEVQSPVVRSPDDQICEEIYAQTVSRDEGGRYVVTLPFKRDTNELGDSRTSAERRFLRLERKLESSPDLRQKYDEVIREYIDKNFISLVNEDYNANSYILPHHAVLREDKLTSKLRIVLDGSCKTTSKLSLNDLLHCGPNLQGDLFKIIANFRLFKIALSADIRQMFLNIGVRKEDRRFQRILYRFSPEEPLKLYEFNRVVFGLKSSPFLALRTLKQLATDEGDLYPLARDAIDNSFYMDDFTHSIERVDDAVALTKEMIGLMKAGQFELVKWASNSPIVLDSISPSLRLTAIKEFDDDQEHKVLGLRWSPKNDSLELRIEVPLLPCTKRNILSCIARIWDVMGLVAPIVLYAKLLIKHLWLSKCDWDELPPKEIVEKWVRFRNELPILSKFKIPRHLGVVSGSRVTILGFADASEKAYGGVVYVHINNNNVITINLLAAKSRVAPNKVISLARLELCAILVLSQLIKTIVDAYTTRIEISNIFVFSDSTVALCWTNSSPHRWNTFVANRVTKIQENLPKCQFRHISGHENPADCLSRGLTPSQLINHSLWLQGPPWAKLDLSEWPVSQLNPNSEELPEQKKLSFLTTACPSQEPLLLELGKRFSSWSKLLNCVTYICRFTKLLKTKGQIIAADLDFAEALIIKAVQSFHFKIEISKLNQGKACSNFLQKLTPYLENGIIRVGGRLQNADIDHDHMHPIILPHKEHIVNILIDYYHKSNCHAGPELLMSLLRQKYWILAPRSLIRSRINKCLPCYRQKAKAILPIMAEHKACRVTRTLKPFIYTGTDYAGPFKITPTRGRGVRALKAYVCIFVCLTTRAVHIELVGDLSTEGFMGALKRFLSRRGPVTKIYSDNGANYVGAKRLLSELYDFLNRESTKNSLGEILATNRIEWSFNAPAASHFGGDWEANVKSLKSHLRRVVGEQILTFEEFYTILTQIEGMMNTRPLCVMSSDPGEPIALTPAHFLNLTPLRYLPNSQENVTFKLTQRYKLIETLIASFWKRWKNDYLHTLQSRVKWNTKSKPIQRGDIAILKTDNTPPVHWPLCVVEEVFPGSDGVVRVVKIRTATGTYIRPVVRLCPLPTSEEQ